MDDGSNTKIGIINKKGEMVRKKGDVILLTEDTIHSIENFSDKPSLTVQNMDLILAMRLGIHIIKSQER